MAEESATKLEPVESGDIYPSDPEKVKKELRRRETVTGNPLSLDVIYTQRLTLLQPTAADDFKQRILKYTDDMLNDAQFGIVFFKARIFSNKDVEREKLVRVEGTRPAVDYVLHFHAFAEDYLTDEKVDMIKSTFLPRLLNDSNDQPLAELTSTELIIHEDTKCRKPVYW